MISRGHLKNFIAFTDLSIDFSPGINIVVGKNATGNTAFKDTHHEAHS